MGVVTALGCSLCLLRLSLARNGTTKPSQTATWRRLVCDKSGGRERPDGQPDLANILNTNEVDCAVDALGFEASGHGHGAGEQPAAVLNSIMTVTSAARWGFPACMSPAVTGLDEPPATIYPSALRPYHFGWASKLPFLGYERPWNAGYGSVSSARGWLTVIGRSAFRDDSTAN